MRILLPLRDRAVALLWAGLATSAVGDQLYAVALSWIAVAVFGAAAGYLTAVQAAAVLLTAVASGGWADRREHRRLMIAADLARAVVLLATVLAWAQAGRPPAWALVAAVLVLAGGQALFRPALQANLPALVTTVTRLPAANALLDTTERIARLLGPGLIALLAGLLPVMHFLTLDAATFLVSAGCIAAIVRLRPTPPTAAAAAAREPGWAAIRRGFSAMRRQALLRYLLTTTGIVNGTWYAAVFLGVPLTIARLHVTGPGGSGLGAFGLVIAAYGSTNLAATLIVGGRRLPARPGRMIFAGNVVLGCGIVLLALAMAAPLPLAWRLPCFMAAAAVAAVGGPLNDIPTATLRQTWLARGDIAAAMRAWLVMNNAGLLLAMLAAPAAFALCGVPAVVAACGAAEIALGAIGLLRHGETAPVALAAE